jgi:hypothetical protein
LWFPKHRNRPNKKQAGVVPWESGVV